MESVNIEKLLEAYFDGDTTLQQEKQLRDYFVSGDVAPHFEKYKIMFVGFSSAEKECSEREIIIPQTYQHYRKWWYGVAASAVIVIGVAGFVFSDTNKMSQEEQEALIAFNKSKEMMLLLSENLNEGTEDLAFINVFSTNKNKYLK